MKIFNYKLQFIHHYQVQKPRHVDSAWERLYRRSQACICQNHVTCGPVRLSAGIPAVNRAMSLLLETSLGDIVIDLEVEACPKTCENFLKLCKVHYYNLNAFFNGPRSAHFLTIRSV
jgi:peptidyl-prolyl cis-trans isomerase-like 4